jgi:enoyl-CoA hydratase/carnithine racemase
MNEISSKDHICFVWLDNKPSNYLDKPEFVNTETLNNIVVMNQCKAIVIAGRNRHFSAGANLDNLKLLAKNGSLKEEISKGKKLLALLRSFNLPIIACIEGVCFGGGLEIVLNADVKIAGKKALFAFPESNLNLIPGLGGTLNLSKITGKAKALEIILAGNIIDAETAFELKIIDHLVEARSGLEKGLSLAKSLTENKDIEIIKAVVEAVRNASELPYEQALERETELFCMLAKNAME